MRIKLKRVTVNKFKSIQKPQSIEIDPFITTLVGMNESGKTTFLEAIAKTNYFDSEDEDFKFDTTQDYPRNELIDFQSSSTKVEIISCSYEISDQLLQQIAEDVGKGVFTVKEFSESYYYEEEGNISGLSTDVKKYIEFKISALTLSNETKSSLRKLTNLNEISSIVAIDGDVDLPVLINEINILLLEKNSWSNALTRHIYIKWILPYLPKFWYFDDYYSLPGKIRILDLEKTPTTENHKTAKALFDLAKIQPQQIVHSDNYERFVALLEASSNKVTSEIFKYWSTNKNLDIEFKIQDIKNTSGVLEKYLDIRVKNQRHKITLPLDRRSKGFNWFFSFIVWFSKIQSEKNFDYILLLDEPGLNLHASAQSDLLRFINDLSTKYQIIYTTHSPFMVESEKLNRVRTCLETEEGTVISDSIQEKDPNTLFPLQAALGYDIAQNLFISKNNLLVEGPADLIYLTIMSTVLETEKRIGLKSGVTIVPVGGLDKVATFISLLRGSKLNIACLLDTFTDAKGKQRVEDLVKFKIIKEKNIRFFDEFANKGKAIGDIEDLFSKEEYLTIFNNAFSGEYSSISISDLDTSLDTIIKQINKVIGNESFPYLVTFEIINFQS